MTRVILLGLIAALAWGAVAAAPRAGHAQEGLPYVLALPGIASDGPPGRQAEALDASVGSWAGNAIVTYTLEATERDAGGRVAVRISVVEGTIVAFEPECRDGAGAAVDCAPLFAPDWTVEGIHARAREALYEGTLTAYRANVNGVPFAATLGGATLDVTGFTTHHDAIDLALARARWATVGVDGYSTTVRFWDPERNLFVLRTAVLEDGEFTTISAQCAAPDETPAPCAAPGPATPDELFDGIEVLLEVYGEGALDVTYDVYDGRPLRAEWGPVFDPGGRAEFRVLFFDLLEARAALALLAGH